MNKTSDPRIGVLLYEETLREQAAAGFPMMNNDLAPSMVHIIDVSGLQPSIPTAQARAIIERVLHVERDDSYENVSARTIAIARVRAARWRQTRYQKVTFFYALCSYAPAESLGRSPVRCQLLQQLKQDPSRFLAHEVWYFVPASLSPEAGAEYMRGGGFLQPPAEFLSGISAEPFRVFVAKYCPEIEKKRS